MEGTKAGNLQRGGHAVDMSNRPKVIWTPRIGTVDLQDVKAPIMQNRYALLLAAALPSILNAQTVLIYQNSFVTPLTTPVNASCQQDFSATPVNTLWQGTGTGTFSGAFQQSNTVETLLINGPAIYARSRRREWGFLPGYAQHQFY